MFVITVKSMTMNWTYTKSLNADKKYGSCALRIIIAEIYELPVLRLSRFVISLSHQEALGVLVKELDQLEEVVCLPGGAILPHHLVIKGFQQKFKDARALQKDVCSIGKFERKRKWQLFLGTI